MTVFSGWPMDQKMKRKVPKPESCQELKAEGVKS